MRPERDEVGGSLPSRRAPWARRFDRTRALRACTDAPPSESHADAEALERPACAGALEGGTPGEIPWDASVEALARRCLAEGLVDTDTDAFRRRALHVLRTLRPDASCADLSEAMLRLRLKLVRRSGCGTSGKSVSMDTSDAGS